jgi:hypothetical protein
VHNVSLAFSPSLPPVPYLRSSLAETFQMWVNATPALQQPSTTFTLTFTAVALPGGGGSRCVLPIPPSSWTASPTTFALPPGGSVAVNVTGTPDLPYPLWGAFALEVQAFQNAPAGAGTIGYGFLAVDLTASG